MGFSVADELGYVVVGIQKGIGENFRPSEWQLCDGGSAEGNLLEVGCEEGCHRARRSESHWHLNVTLCTSRRAYLS